MVAVAGVAIVGIVAYVATRPQVGSAGQVIQQAPDTTESIGVAAVSAVPELVGAIGGLFGPPSQPFDTAPGYYSGPGTRTGTGKRRA